MRTDATWREHLELLLDVVEQLAPGAILAVYLHGSRAQGTALPDSDVDLTVVVDGTNALKDVDSFLRGRSLPSGETLDAHVDTIHMLCDPLYALVSSHVKHSGRLIRGQDVRDRLPGTDHAAYRAALVDQACKGIAMLRDADRVEAPLEVPEASMPFYGYETVRKTGWYSADVREGTKELVAVATFCASAWVTSRELVFINSKTEAVAAIRRSENGSRANIVESIFELCRERYQGGVPTDASDRRALRDILPGFLELEREVLTLRA